MLPELSKKVKPLIRMRYGPYEANGLIKHRQQKLKGLIDYFQRLDYVIELIEIANLDMLNIEILGTNVYEGSIKFLNFNTECKDDKVCQQIICKVREALHRLYNPASPSKDATQSNESVVNVLHSTIALKHPKIEVNYFRSHSL